MAYILDIMLVDYTVIVVLGYYSFIYSSYFPFPIGAKTINLQGSQVTKVLWDAWRGRPILLYPSVAIADTFTIHGTSLLNTR